MPPIAAGIFADLLAPPPPSAWVYLLLSVRIAFTCHFFEWNMQKGGVSMDVSYLDINLLLWGSGQFFAVPVL